MDAGRNPYSPGAGSPPAALTGRDDELEAWDVALSRAEAGRSARSPALYGLRGVGKTVLLSQYAKRAKRANWVVAQVEAIQGGDFRETLSVQLRIALARLATPTASEVFKGALRTLSSFRASVDSAGTWSLGFDLSSARGGGADSGNLESDLATLVTDLAAAAAEDGHGIAILVDEAQDLTNDELAALCAALHRANQDAAPVLIAVAGLPSLPRVLSEAKSYAERLFDYRPIGALGESATKEAIVRPSDDLNVSWMRDAVDEVVTVSDGYPFFIQQVAHETWNAARGPAIEEADARVGAAEAQRILDAGFYRARWERATTAEKRYMRAMGVDGENGSSSSAVGARLGRSQSSVAPLRARLMGKGLIYAPDHGVVAFTVPGMAAFIGRQPEMEE